MRKLVGAALAMTLFAGAAQAQNKLQIGCTATTDCASAMVAVDEGIFKKHGLDVEMTLIGINSNIPAAILSGSIQIGGPTATVFLQAADGGLDLVAVGGAAYLVSKAVQSARVIAFADLGMEAIYEFRVEDMPVTVAVDARGRSVHDFTLRVLRDVG